MPPRAVQPLDDQLPTEDLTPSGPAGRGELSPVVRGADLARADR